MKRIDLTKFGFVRTPEEDFRDDLSKFTCYKVGKVRVSKCTYYGDVYISGRIDDNLSYDEYSKLPHYRAMYYLNGVSLATLDEEEIKKFYDDCVAYEQEYDAMLARVIYPEKAEVLDLATNVRNARKAEIDYLNKNLTAPIIFTISNSSESTVKNYYNTLAYKLAQAQKTIDEIDIMSDYQRKLYCENQKSEVTTSWYFEEIKRICKI